MERESLPTAQQLNTRFSMYGVVAGLSTPVVASLYLYLLADLDWGDWTAFGLVIFFVGAATCVANLIWTRSALAPIRDWLEGQAEGETSTSSNLGAFAATIAFPSDAQRAATMTSASAAIAASLLLMIVGGAGWSLGVHTFVVLLGGVTAGIFVGIAQYALAKRDLVLIGRELVERIPDPAERRNHIQHVSISRRIAFALAATVATLLLLTMTLAHSHSEAALYDVALEWQDKALQAVVSQLGTASFEDAAKSVLGDRRLLPYPVRFELIDASVEAPGTAEYQPIREAILARVGAGEPAGRVAKTSQDSLWVYRDLSGGRVATAQILRQDVLAGSSPGFPGLGVLLLVSVGIALLVARLISDDLLNSLSSLRRTSEMMASGDLRRGRIFESEDELGDLWRSFESMSEGFRSTIKGLADAADRFDATAGEIASVADGVTSASQQQVQSIQRASELMISINSQVMDVAGAAQNLNISVEESSSSILELGATGDELNETASVLGGKVEEVSTSIEQMVRSVKQVSATSDGLADAAAETSASMEEMASAMRAVDTTAELTADLSRNVVQSAELGQLKVSQTIDGMQAIRDATDTAEQVIRGLGARTQEIGAILDVIDDVAEETNLLALNAAIIAAQAGEHGRAFSVVADEIKELADRVLASTKEIGSLIRAVQDESDNAVGAMEVGSRSVASGVELSAEAGLSLEQITSSSRESGQRIAEIVSAVREQTKAASHVVALMDTVRDGVTAIVSAAADQDRGNEVVYRSSVTMREVTQQVRRTTEEQSRGFGRIRGSIEGVREVVENVNGSLTEQSAACSKVAEFLEEVSERTRSNEESATSMGESIRGLVAQAEALREHVVKFKI